jgi:hypothetical protein
MQKQSILNIFQIKSLNWYIPLTLNGVEIPEQHCPHFFDTQQCEYFLSQYPIRELNLVCAPNGIESQNAKQVSKTIPDDSQN